MTKAVAVAPAVKDLAGQRVLLIAPRFFGYDTEIAEGLRRRGAHVDSLPDRPVVSSLAKALTRLQRHGAMLLFDRFYRTAIAGLTRRGGYDHVFVVVGEGLSARVLRELRVALAPARFVLYMWDSMHSKRVSGNLRYFDKTFTFDETDAKAFSMVYRPLFFVPGFEPDATPPQYALSFVGTVHSDRYAILSRLRRSLPPHVTAYWYLFLQARWVFWLYRLTRPSYAGATLAEFHFKPLSRSELARVFAASLAVLDIEHPGQTGLTMRTFETLGAGKKLVTTNRRVRFADFYDPRNILVIDRHHGATIPDDFLNTPYHPLPEGIRDRYTLKAWLEEIIPLATVGAP